MTTTIKYTVILLFSLIIACPEALAAGENTPTFKDVTESSSLKTVEETVRSQIAKVPYDEYGRITPRSSVLGLAKALTNRDFETATHYMDLRNLPFTIDKASGPDLARKLLIIAERSMILDYEALSNDPKGHVDDGLPSYRDRVTVVKTRDGPVDILMQRVPRGDGVFIWKLSNATVAKIPALNEELGYGPIGDKLSLIFPEHRIAGFEIWQWLILLVIFAVGYLLAYVITWLLEKLFRPRDDGKNWPTGKLIKGPLRFLIVVLFFRSVFDLVAPSLEAQALFEAHTLLIIAIAWTLMGLVNILMHKISERMKYQGHKDVIVLLKPVATALRLGILFTSCLTWLDNLGYEVTALLAGLGVGGVAVAFAAQRSIENLIGSITIYASQPVHVGDFCKFDGILGVIEEISLRSTKIRTLDRTVVHIPNARFSTENIENLTQRDKILYRTRLRLSLQTTPEQMQDVLKKLRELISQHGMIDAENSRVRFLEFGEYAQELDLFLYITTTDFAEYLEAREEINLQITGIIDQSGTKMVVPANTTYLETGVVSTAGQETVTGSTRV